MKLPHDSDDLCSERQIAMNKKKQQYRAEKRRAVEAHRQRLRAAFSHPEPAPIKPQKDNRNG